MIGIFSKRTKQSLGDATFSIIAYAMLSIAFLIVLYPLIFIVSASFSSPRALISGWVVLWPKEFSLVGYQTVLKSRSIILGYGNSIIYTVIGTIINIVMTVMAAYPLSRKDFIGRNLIMIIFMLTMWFSGGLIPFYLLMKNLHLLDTRWAMVLPGALSVWNMIIARTYFRSNIPDELYEAASIDGCRDIPFILRIVLPLSGPILAVLTLYYAVGHWNSYFDALILLKSQSLFPLQLVLREILLTNQLDSNMIADMNAVARRQGLGQLLKYSVIVVASLPVMIIYPFVQKYFVRGVMIGALKG